MEVNFETLPFRNDSSMDLTPLLPTIDFHKLQQSTQGANGTAKQNN